jgi:phage-related protein
MIVGAIGAIINGIIDAFVGLATTLIGGSVIPEMIADIASYLGGAAVSAVRSAVQAIAGAIASVFQALNPLNWGSTIVNGLKNGLNQGISAVRSAADAVVGAVSGVVDGLNPMNWGSDLANEFADGISNTVDSVADSAENVADSIANSLGFDNVQNDRMARRWGSDLAQEFSSGLASERKNLERTARGAASGMGSAMSATPPGTGGGGGGASNVIVRFERGAINDRGRGQRPEVNERNVTKEQGSAFNSRSNI